jgi:hypothetical protein
LTVLRFPTDYCVIPRIKLAFRESMSSVARVCLLCAIHREQSLIPESSADCVEFSSILADFLPEVAIVATGGGVGPGRTRSCTMWCPECRQDVPGIASGATGKLCCVRCRAPVTSAGRAARPANEPRPAEPPVESATPEADLAAQLDALERLTTWEIGEGLSPPDWSALEPSDMEIELPPRRRGSIDPPHSVLRGWHHHSGTGAPTPAVGYFKSHRKSLLGWTLLSTGLASFFCGAALLTWSLVGGRSDLWTIGVPITLAGQVGLLLGVVLALDRLGQQNRQTVDRLGRLDERMDELRAAAWLSAQANQTAGIDTSRDLFS